MANSTTGRGLARLSNEGATSRGWGYKNVVWILPPVKFSGGRITGIFRMALFNILQPLKGVSPYCCQANSGRKIDASPSGRLSDAATVLEMTEDIESLVVGQPGAEQGSA